MSRFYPPDVCDLEEISYLTSMAPGTFETHVAAKLLPRPVKIGGKRFWIRSQVIEAIAARAAGQANVSTKEDILEAARGKKKAA
jgi:predicted DNA-binding transcriptional regulator AlpA